MDFIRGTEEYKALLKKYKEKNKKEEKNVPIGVFKVVDSDKSNVSEVPFTKENGVCKVKCNVNGLPLHFVFDTGASDVTISMVEATFMMKNGYLSGNDVVGSQRYMDANGDVTVGTVVNLRNVNFGGLDLDNVKASVVRNQKAPLLLGQSVLGRLGKIEIDNSKNVLKISKNKY
jgi:clan AA aspartic protease (TIGR02281 family)